MDFQRLFLFIALSFVLLLIWEAWQQDYGQPAPTPTHQQAAPASGAPGGTGAPTASEPAAPQTAEVPAAVPQQGANAAPAQPQALKSRQRIEVVTDVYHGVIDTFGGDLRQLDLLKYPVSTDKPDEPIQLMEAGPSRLFVAQSGFAEKKPEATVNVAAPNHTTVYRAAATSYRLQPGQDTLDVPLEWTSPEGVRFTKIYRFHRGTYEVDVIHRVANPTAKPWEGALYAQFQRSPEAKGHGLVGSRTYTGGVIYSPEDKYQKIPFDDLENKRLSRQISDGWLAIVQHYFLGAWIPPQGKPYHYYSSHPDANRVVLGLYSPQQRVAPGAQQEMTTELFAGPKLQDRLDNVAPGLALTVDYGWLTVISKPLFWLLEKIHSVLGNWGWSIVILTLLIKLAFYKLSETSYKSMAHMRKVQPRMMQLKERYGEDRQRMNQALMELYKKEKINPLGGCLPIVVQIPVFIALYWMLLESVELRQAPWILWIHDLSIRDPYFVLPIVMGLTMLLQQRLNPAPMDPLQQKVMMALPVVFTFFFAFFPAGLVVYWVVNNTLSIAQQYYITRVVMKER